MIKASMETQPTLSISGRVAYVVNHSFPHSSNGYAVRTHGVASALVENGHSVIVINRPGRPWDIAGTKVARSQIYHQQDGVNYLSLPQPSICDYSSYEQWCEAAATALEQAFRVYKPAVVIAASNWENAAPALLAAQRLKLQFYYEVRGFWELSRGSADPQWQLSDEFKQAVAHENTIATAANRVITLNPLMRQELINRGVAADKILLIPNGVSHLPELSSPKVDTKPRVNVGYIGSFADYEGLDDLLQAVALLRQSGLSISLTLVGSGNQSGIISSDDRRASQQLQAKVEQLGIAQWVNINERVANSQIASYYCGVDVMVNPRRSYPVTELVSSLKPIEAAAYGKPVLLSDVAPNKLLADECDAFTLFSSSDVIDLAAKLKALLTNPSLYQRSVAYGYQWVADKRQFKALIKPLSQQLWGGARTYMQTQLQHLISIKQGQASINTVLANTVDTVKVGFEITSETKFETQKFVLSSNVKVDLAELDVKTAGATLSLQGVVEYRFKNDKNTRKAVLLFDFLDASGNKLYEINGIGISSAFKQHFRYLTANSLDSSGSEKNIFTLKLPKAVARVKIAVCGLGLKLSEEISLRISGKCFSEMAEQEYRQALLKCLPLPQSIAHKPNIMRFTNDLTIACVLDEFTTECLSHEVRLIKVTQESWHEELKDVSPDFLLVESCWKGNNGNWGTLTKGSGGAKKLRALLEYCNQQSIPTVFWNKEDPPHYEKFGPTAILFDLVITTDINMIPKYKKDFGVDVYPLSFAAQPKIHNPLAVIPRLQKAVFAGSYYGDKPNRCEDFNDVMGEVAAAGIRYDIYDRNYGLDISKFAFPEIYESSIVGNLPASDVWKAHKGYKYQINMNTVKDSETMFARRVYESLASGTPVISNDSVGVRELFGELVIMPNEFKTITEQLEELEKSPELYRDCARRGVRAVMREHTYGHRIKIICQLLGIEVDISSPKGTLAIKANSDDDVLRAKELFAMQTALNKHLFIELNNFDTAYKYLNQSDDNISYAMALANRFYADESQYYGSKIVLKHSLADHLTAEALEDYIYWREV